MNACRNPPSEPTWAVSAHDPWPEEFFTAGFSVREPWNVFLQVPTDTRRTDCILNTPGWAFGLYTYRVLHAPRFDKYAQPIVCRRIAQAIREYPARRAAFFEQTERPFYEANGWPLLDQLAPRAERRLRPSDFRSPILVVTRAEGTRNYRLLGGMVTLDIFVGGLIARPDVKVSRAQALMILLSCHAKPLDVKVEMGSDGLPIVHENYRKSAFTRLFHPKLYWRLREELHDRFPGERGEALHARLLQSLAQHIPTVVESLRRRPSRRDSKHLLSVMGSRLVKSVEGELLGSTPREGWRARLGLLSRASRQRFYRELTPAEREEVHNARLGKQSARTRSTKSVHLSNAMAKYRNMFHELEQ